MDIPVIIDHQPTAEGTRGGKSVSGVDDGRRERERKIEEKKGKEKENEKKEREKGSRIQDLCGSMEILPAPSRNNYQFRKLQENSRLEGGKGGGEWRRGKDGTSR